MRGGSGGEVATVLNCDWVISFNKKNSFSSEKGSACFQFEKVVYSLSNNNIHLMYAHRFSTRPVLTVSPKEYTASKNRVIRRIQEKLLVGTLALHTLTPSLMKMGESMSAKHG